MDKLWNSMKEIFLKSQESSSRHQRCVQMLQELYKTVSFEDFMENFVRCLTKLLIQDANINNLIIDRSFTFASKFCVHIAFDSDTEPIENDEEETHPLLTGVISEILKYHNLDCAHIRTRTCKFITLLLQHVGEREVDNGLCDIIQDAMLQRIQDTKTSIRLQAIIALQRLQIPNDDECPVVKAFLDCLYDSQATVRKSVVECICPTNVTIPKIIERLCDIDANVRLAALTKCSNLNPGFLAIANRQKVLLMGFSETNSDITKVFCTSLLPKWLLSYQQNVVRFFKALKLDADENDIQQTLYIYKGVMENLSRSSSTIDKLEYLPLNNSKLIPQDELSFEVAAFWNIMCAYMQEEEDKSNEEFLTLVQPELREFCNYIDLFIKNTVERNVDDWEAFKNHQILLQLLEIVERYDFSDEVGRQSLRQIIFNVLVHSKLEVNLVSKMVNILDTLSNNTTELFEELLKVMLEIRQPTVQVNPSETEIRDHNFKLAGLRVELNVLNDQLEEPNTNDEPEKVKEINEKISRVTKEIAEMGSQPTGKLVKQNQTDSDAVAKCLDIAIAFLQLPRVTTVLPMLAAFKEEFIDPIKPYTDRNLFWRVSKVLSLFGLLDKEHFLENRRRILAVIMFHRGSVHFDKNSLLVAIEATSDMLRLYGNDAFVEENQNAEPSQNGRKGQRRRLYEDAESTMSNVDNTVYDFHFVCNLLVDLVENKFADVRLTAVTALMKILMSGSAPECPILISKLILKWLCQNDTDPKLQQVLGATIMMYAKKNANIVSVEKSVVPVILEIANAPNSSPVSHLDVDSALRFLAAITAVETENDVNGYCHKRLALAICDEINLDQNVRTVRLLSKFLLHLNFFDVDLRGFEEILARSQNLAEDMTDKVSRTNMQKFLKVLNTNISNLDPETRNENSKTTRSHTVNGSIENSTLITPKHSKQKLNTGEIVSTKRKKKQSKNASELSEIIDETVLNSTIENSSSEESLMDNELIIMVPSQDSEQNQALSNSEMTG